MTARCYIGAGQDDALEKTYLSRFSALFKLEHVPSAFIADGLARLTGSLPRDPRGLRRLAEVRRRVDLPVLGGCSFGCQWR